MRCVWWGFPPRPLERPLTHLRPFKRGRGGAKPPTVRRHLCASVTSYAARCLRCAVAPHGECAEGRVRRDTRARRAERVPTGARRDAGHGRLHRADERRIRPKERRVLPDWQRAERREGQHVVGVPPTPPRGGVGAFGGLGPPHFFLFFFFFERERARYSIKLDKRGPLRCAGGAGASLCGGVARPRPVGAAAATGVRPPPSKGRKCSIF
jgi:hypothetical protein